jgi:hypothetical protein
MKFYFFLCFLMNSQAAFSQADVKPTPTKPTPALAYPAIRISKELSQALSLGEKKTINCQNLLSTSLTYPNGSAVALCDDAQLACLRYGLLVKEIEETAKSKHLYLEELKKTLVIEKQEIMIRLRGCELALKRTIHGEALQDAAGYPASSYDATSQSTSSSQSSPQNYKE